MTVFSNNDNRVALRSIALSALAGAVGAGAMLALTAMDAPAQDKIPELASSQFAWLAAGADWRDMGSGQPRRHDQSARKSRRSW